LTQASSFITIIYIMNLADVIRDFHDEETCVCFLETQRWPKGVECVKCQSKRISRITSKGKTGKPRFIYECMNCDHQFSVRTGTLFHDSHLPLTKWFMAIAVICQAKKGISANQVSRTIGVSVKTAWYLCHRIREAMNVGGPLLQNIVELDEMFVGGKQIGKGVWYGKQQKAVVMGLKERGGEVRFVHTPDAKAPTWKTQIEKHVNMPKVEYVMTDEANAVWSVLRDNPKHHVIQHKAKEYVRGIVSTNSVESSFSLFKRGLVGSWHKLSKKHLARYLSEMEYKHNNRKNLAIFENVLQGIATKPRLTFRALVDGQDAQVSPF
jgi:transposase-like protein